LKNVRVMFKLPDLNKLNGGAVEFELPILPGDVLVNGVSVVRPPIKGGI